MRTAFLVAGIVLLLVGAGVLFYQLSESCEESTLPNAVGYFPWCTDVLDHINLTFVGVVGLFAGVVVLALGGSLHWILEPSEDATETSP